MISSFFSLISRRLMFGLIFLLCFITIAYAFYAQFVNGAEPCPLCIAQRVIYGLVGIIAVVAFLHNPKGWGSKIYSILILLTSLFGIKIAHHHVWLQSLPPEQWPASCGMPLSVLYKRIPLSGFLHTILSGTAECAAVSWTVWGISGPKLSMYGFIILALASIYILLHRQTKLN